MCFWIWFFHVEKIDRFIKWMFIILYVFLAIVTTVIVFLHFKKDMILLESRTFLFLYLPFRATNEIWGLLNVNHCILIQSICALFGNLYNFAVPEFKDCWRVLSILYLHNTVHTIDSTLIFLNNRRFIYCMVCREVQHGM